MYPMKTMIVLTCLTICTTIPALGQSKAPDEVDLAKASLDTVWQTVFENHFDSTFGGLDWKEIHNRYAELAAVPQDDESFIKLLNQMLLELKLSHYSVFRVEDKAGASSPLSSEGSIGIDLRLFGNDVVITTVDPGFPAAQAGIKPGYQIKSIDGLSIQQILSDAAAKHLPTFNERHKISRMCREVLNHCFKRPGDSVTITYEDGAGVAHDVTLQMKQRTGGIKIAEELPTVFVDFRWEQLPNDIGYIYFSKFFPPVDSLFLAAMDSMSNIRSLIIDIRGNPGGMHTIGEAIASKLVSRKTLFSIFRYRDSIQEVSVDPDPPVFEGPVAILIDVMNGSAAERFPACMQSIGRAKIIGEWSPGSVGPSNVKRLPNGASFIYLVAQSTTPDGTVLEGHGVIPDITVPLDRAALLKGVDTQIERAIVYLKSEID
jgi:carboxyl-terminal processing protease